MAESLKGRLLVARPGLDDPNFDRAVVLVLEHDDTGAVGVVLNRPSETEVEAPLGSWRRFATEPSVVFQGGPVSPDAALCLARPWPGEVAVNWDHLFESLGILDLTIDPDLVAASVQAIRVFAGYAGWGGGQLEIEIEEGSWWVLEALEGDVLGSDPEELWWEVLRRQGGDLAMFANYPLDPAMN